MFEKQGHVVVVSLISPYDDIRNQIRAFCQNFVEVYLSTDIETCIQRDPKGLYKKALNGEINDFTGISAPYYPPLNPEIELDTAQLSIEQCTLKIIHYLQQT
jgi:adenylylsulfate kinase